MNIAFIYEWTLLAESIGVNLFEVVDAIRVRKGTHDNMRYPGFGVGGYCLTKDSLLAQWGARHLLGSEVELGMTLAALKTNRLMPLHTVALVRELIGGDLASASVALLGVSYIADLADTRNSPAEILVDDLLAAGARVRVHDPHVREWPERPHLPVVADISAAVCGADAVVLAVPHRAYRDLPPDAIIDATGKPAVIVDGQNILSDVGVRRYRDAGWRAMGVGKGHWRKKGYHLQP